jgi:fatty-acyl-CoA synthase
MSGGVCVTRMNPGDDSYDRGSSEKGLIDKAIGSYFDRIVETCGEKLALVVRHQQVRWTWGELGRRVDDLAAGLIALGLQRGDRLGIWSPNRAEWVVTQFAAA